MFEEIYSYTIEDTYSELKKLKQLTNYVENSENYCKIEQINKKDPKALENYSKISLLNKEIYDKLNEHLINRIKIINKLKSQKNDTNLENYQFELYLTPDISKVRLFSKTVEIKKGIAELDNKIGKWDIVR